MENWWKAVILENRAAKTIECVVSPNSDSLSSTLTCIPYPGAKQEIVVPGIRTEEEAIRAIKYLGLGIDFKIVTKSHIRPVKVRRIRPIKFAKQEPVQEPVPSKHSFTVGRGRPPKNPAKRKCCLCGLEEEYHG